ncbi:hypothetical protein K466DRAFT_399346 [Polyporus arcularius HHB13444]|uniref:Uncharacterized protein n=1 Tax=Polyporus arcularius HHB13444 TaxID=1314778 RepID=A0A5C3PPQ7_9APHY|nr:hypothetical protein K466DRAFT_399346 [Polyporus arcularius HHB13444]
MHPQSPRNLRGSYYSFSCTSQSLVTEVTASNYESDVRHHAHHATWRKEAHKVRSLQPMTYRRQLRNRDGAD